MDKETRIEQFLDLYTRRKYTMERIADMMGVSIRTLFRYKNMPSVIKRIEEEEERVKDQYKITKDFIIEKYLEIYHSANEDEVIDRRSMLESLKQLARLAGLDKEEIDINVKSVVAFKIKPKEEE